MRYEILGPLRVTDRGRSSFIGPQKVEVVLAALLIRSDQVVTIEQLVDEIWSEKAPRRAVAGIHVYISQLRKFLNHHGQMDNPISTRYPGYILRIGPDEFDLWDYERLMNLGRAYAREGSHQEAVDCLGDALSLWRGPVLDRARHGPIVEGFVVRINEARLECVEMLMDSSLMLGRHRELIGELYALTAEYPLREMFYRQLMLALYRSERQADALQVYQRARQRLQDELGLEPCRTLREIQHAILVSDDQLR